MNFKFVRVIKTYFWFAFFDAKYFRELTIFSNGQNVSAYLLLLEIVLQWNGNHVSLSLLTNVLKRLSIPVKIIEYTFNFI